MADNNRWGGGYGNRPPPLDAPKGYKPSVEVDVWTALEKGVGPLDVPKGAKRNVEIAPGVRRRRVLPPLERHPGDIEEREIQTEARQAPEPVEPDIDDEVDALEPGEEEDIADDFEEAAAQEPPERHRRMLDAHDLNIGAQKLIVANVPSAVGDAGRGRETALLDLEGDSQVGQVVTVVFAAYDPRNFPDGSTLAAEPGVPVGIVRFGNGAGLAEVEIDIPNPDSHTHGTPYAAAGTAISVPAGNLRVLARDDGRVKPGAGQSCLVADGVAGGQLISAHVVYGDRGSPGKVYRTLFFAISSLAAGDSVVLRVPAFSRSVQFFRHGPRGALTCDFQMGWTAGGGPFVMDSVALANGDDSPVFPVPPRVTQIKITNAEAVSAITSGMAVFEIAL